MSSSPRHGPGLAETGMPQSSPPRFSSGQRILIGAGVAFASLVVLTFLSIGAVSLFVGDASDSSGDQVRAAATPTACPPGQLESAGRCSGSSRPEPTPAAPATACPAGQMRLQSTGTCIDDPAGVTANIATAEPTKPSTTAYRKLTARQWARIAKNPDAHVGEAYVVFGYVTQADAATGDDTVRANVDGVRHGGEYGYLDYDTNTMLQEGNADFTDLVEDDIFQAKVIVSGSLSYETTLGGELTAPVLLVNSIRVTGSAD